MGTVRTLPGRLSALSVFRSKSVLYGIFVWARRALNHRKRRFPARAVEERHRVDNLQQGALPCLPRPPGGDLIPPRSPRNRRAQSHRQGMSAAEGRNARSARSRRRHPTARRTRSRPAPASARCGACLCVSLCLSVSLSLSVRARCREPCGALALRRCDILWGLTGRLPGTGDRRRDDDDDQGVVPVRRGAAALHGKLSRNG
jgi:hypothetical protein